MSFRPDELAPVAAANWSYQMVGRLKPGVSAKQAESDAETVAQEIMRDYPPMIANLHISAMVRPLREDVTLQTRPLLRTLFLAVAVVLLIACVNLAGLMLVRAIRQQREVAVRLALGARASALLRQAILESLVLSVSGGVLGLTMAAVALRVGKSMLPESLPRISEIGLNWNVVGFALVLGVVTGLVCGMVPAFAALRTNVNANLKEGGRSGSEGGGHARLRSTLVVAEIAVALVLLTASCLLLRSFEKMRSVDLGFRPDHVTTATYHLPQKQYEKQSQVDTFNRELLQRLNALPGVTTVGITSQLPAGGANNNQTFVVEGYTPPKGADLNLATTSQVIGNFFPAMGIPLLRGRFFTDSDRHGAQLVVIVNHKMAQHFWPGQDPIGKRVRIGTPEMQTPWMTVVGEVADVKLTSPDEPSKEQYYTAVDQGEDIAGSLAQPTDLNGNDGFIVLRSLVPAEQMENAMRAAVRSIDPLLPLTQVQTMEHVVSQSEAPRRFNTVLIGSFAFAAVLLAVLGIYSVIAFSVASRVQEMAIRMALGSQRGGHREAGAAVGSQAGGGRLRDRAGRSCGGFETDAVAFVRGESVRSAGVDGWRPWECCCWRSRHRRCRRCGQRRSIPCAHCEANSTLRFELRAGFDGKGGLNRQVVARAAGQHAHLFLLDAPRMTHGVPVGQVARLQIECDVCLRAGLDSHPLESFELEPGPVDDRAQVLHVHLDDFIAGALAGVLHFYRDLNGAVGGRGWRTQLQAFVGECRVAEAVAEGVERLVLAVHVGAAVE